MNLNIAVCDDDPIECKLLQRILTNCTQDLEHSFRIEQFHDGTSFLEACANRSFDIVFMDIFMKGINGIETVRQAGNESGSQFVFTTTSRDHAIEAFSLNAAHYLLKPLSEEGIREALTRCLARMEQKPSGYLNIKTSQGQVPVPTDNIIYIEVHNKLSVIHTGKNMFSTYSSLDTLYELLEEEVFMRAQRSFIVNMHYIEAFHYDHVLLKGGKEIVLSRNNRANLKKKYQQFLFQLARRGDL